MTRFSTLLKSNVTMKGKCLKRVNLAKVTLIVSGVLGLICYMHNYVILNERMAKRDLQLHVPQVKPKEIGNIVTRPTTKRTTVVSSTQIVPKEIGSIVTRPTTKRTTVLSSTHIAPKENKRVLIRQQKELPFRDFSYPLHINFTELIINISKTGNSDVAPINVYPFTYLKSNENACKTTNQINLLYLIKSAPGNFDQRQAIRETWTNRIYFKQDSIRHVFLLARTMNKTINARVSQEEGTYNDIVQMTYVDAYYNNTYKTIGGINWCVRYCSKAKFVMMVDDDFYVATDLLLDYLNGLSKIEARSLFAGKVWYDHPQRHTSGKWYMSVKDYPFNQYPPFPSAGAMIMSMDFVKKLQIAIPFTKKFKFDDVFIAIVAHKLGVKPIHLPSILITEHITYNDKEFNSIIAAHQYENPNDLRIAWAYHLQQMKIHRKYS